MNNASFQRPRLSAIAILVAMLSGCASTSTEPEAAVQAQDQLIAPGSVAIVTGRYTPETSVHSQQSRSAMAGQGVGKGAATGAAAGLIAPLQMGPLGIALYPFIAPYTVLIGTVGGGAFGAVKGAARGMSGSHLEALHPPLERALREQKIQDAMAHRVLQQGADIPHYRFVSVGNAGPASAADRPEYQELKAAGYDSVLEIAVASVGFDVVKGVPPSAVFEMKLRARVVPLSAQGSPFVRELQHRGTWRGVSEWADDDGRRLQQELDQSYRVLARDLSQAVFRPVSAE